MDNTSKQFVFIVEDENDVREVLIELVESVNLQSKSYANAQDFLNDYQGEMGCLICDVRLPGMSGLHLQEKLLTTKQNLPIIFITGHGDVPMAIRAIRKGAVDFLCKPINNHDLLEQIHTVMENNQNNFRDHLNQAQYENNFSKLSIRELEILSAIANGQTNKTIASQLSLSVHTVEVHRANIMKKTKVKSLGHLVALAVKYGIVRLAFT